MDLFLGRTPKSDGEQPIYVNVPDHELGTFQIIDIKRRYEPGLKALLPLGVSTEGWYSAWRSGSRTYYVARKVPKASGGRTEELAHRHILGLQPGDGMEAHHINHCGLDDRTTNIKVMSEGDHKSLSCKENGNVGIFATHRVHRAKSSIGYYGVGLRRSGNFKASATVAGQKQKYLGTHSTAELAARAVDAYLRQFDPNDPRINFK